MDNNQKLDATKAAIILALDANGPMSSGELVREVKTQAYMSTFARALHQLKREGVIRHVDTLTFAMVA